MIGFIIEVFGFVVATLYSAKVKAFVCQRQTIYHSNFDIHRSIKVNFPTVFYSPKHLNVRINRLNAANTDEMNWDPKSAPKLGTPR